MSLRNLILNLVVFFPMMVSNPFTRNPRPTASIRIETAEAVLALPRAYLPPSYQDAIPEFSGTFRFLPSTSGIVEGSSDTVSAPRLHPRPQVSRIERKPYRRALDRMPRPNFNASVQLVVGPVGAASQGTIACLPGEGLAIVTHDHFDSPSLDSRDDLYLKRFGDGSFTGHVDIRAHLPESTRFDEVNLIPLGEDCPETTGDAAVMAGQDTIERIRPGDWVQVLYNAGTQAGEFDLEVAAMQVLDVSGTSLQVHDPDRLINKGDSGGAVYFEGELIGVLWSIGDYGFGPGVNVSLLTTEIR